MEHGVPDAVRPGGALVDPPRASWEAFAAREPYFAVLTAPKFLRANLTAGAEREFFASGEELVDWMFRVAERLSPHFSPMSSLEYGCGPGRLAIPLARRPGAVVAVDRSPAMLAAARLEAGRRGAAHLQCQTAADLFASPRRFDFISCVQVLQRLPPRLGLDLIRALIARLATGGIAVFHLPFRTRAGAAIRASRWLREHAGLVNGAGNVLRRKPFGDPFIPAHTYDLDAVLRLLDEAGAAAAHVVYEHDAELTSAFVFAHVPMPSSTGVDDRGRPLPGTSLRVPPARDESASIAVGTLIAATPIEELNRAAEAYFASLTDWEDHLAKPFSAPAETPRLLADAAALLHGLQLRPGATVLELGAGTGWLSRWMTQLGCRVVLADVSATALRIAREHYARLPVVGERPAPEFQTFDGRRLDLPDASVDRVVAFDAFHHVPNPDAVVRELARVLRPGGIAGFAEPGARHSDSPMSQFEMRTYGVVENDVDVHAIWRSARAAGFAAIRLALFHGPPFHVSLEEFEDVLAGGATAQRWLTSSRVFLRNARHFFLIREGEEPLDSRTTAGLSCAIEAALAEPAEEGRPWIVDASVTNTGRARWLPSDAVPGGVCVGAHLFGADGSLLRFDLATGPLAAPARAIAPGETVRCRLALPPQPPGRYRVELDCVASRVAWFAQFGAGAASLHVEVTKRP